MKTKSSSVKTKTLPAELVLKRIIRNIKKCSDENPDFLVSLCEEFYPIRGNKRVVGARDEVGDKIVLKLEEIN